METILNSHVSLNINGQIPQGFALLDQQTLGRLKYQVAQDIERVLSSDIQKTISDLPPANIVKILDRVGHDVCNSAIAKFLYQKNQTAIQELLIKLNLDAITIATLESINISDYLHKLETDIHELLAKISELSKRSTEDRNYKGSTILNNLSLENMQEYYDITKDILTGIKTNQNLIEQLTAFTKQVRTKWFILRDYIDMKQEDALYIENKFSSYTEFLNELINVNRDSPSYFEDIFAYLHGETNKAITDEYERVWNRLVRHLSGKSNYTNDLLDIAAELQLPEYENFLPIKDKFTTEQLEHNAEVLNTDLTKFAFSDISKLSHSELTDLAAQYQIKIKKNLAITKELHNRNINNKLSLSNKVNHLLAEYTMHNNSGDDNIVNVYKDFFIFIANNDLIVHKWNLLELLHTELTKVWDNSNINNQDSTLLIDEINTAQDQLNKLQADKDIYVLLLEYKQLQELAGLYEQLISYYEEAEANRQGQYIYDAAYNLLHNAVSKLTINSEFDQSIGLPHTTLNLVPQLMQPDYTCEFNRIIENQELIKQMLATPKKNKIASLQFKKISSTGTSDSEHEERPDNIQLSTPPQSPNPVSLKLELLQLEKHEAQHLNNDDIVEEEYIKDVLDHNDDELENSTDINNNKIKMNQIEESTPEYELPEKVASIEEAATQYNKPEYITRSVSNLAYFCRACNKQLKFGSTKPIAHCKTNGHNKKFLQWVNKNNLIMH